MNDFSIGSLVEFRGREWVVMPSDDDDLAVIRPFTGSEQDTCGIYLPMERGKLRSTTLSLPAETDLGDFESARLLRDAARLLLRNGAAPFRCMGHLNFRPQPYQLVPLLMALRLDPVRMLIADDVGIGKTIEAGLIARELLDRGEIKRLVVVCPPYLCDQWQKELSQKFAIDAKIIRTNTLARLERGLPRQDLSVFEYYPYTVVSIDFIKSHRRRDAFLLHVPQLVIVDEAHSASRPAGQAVSQQQRHELVHDLAKKKDRHLILVTATPHSGIEESFFSLLGLVKAEFEQYNLDELDKTNREKLARHFIQRQRADVKRWLGTTTLFPQREAYEVSFQLSTEYKHLFNDVYRFARGLVTGKGSETESKQRVRYWAALALLRCVMSSPAAAKAALLARIERLTETTDEEQNYAPDVYDPTDLEASADVVPAHVIHESEASMTETERRKLREFSKRSEGLKGDSDTKIAKAEELVRDLLKDGFRPIIFCRFIATSDHVAEELQSRLRKDFKNIQILSVTGAYTEEERDIRIQELAQSKQRVLVATDCLSEGINLQEYFDAVIHYDLPWNPNRLEQREGRVDRFGQKKDPVKAVILYGSDNPIDGAVLNVLLRKAKKIHKRLGITVPIPVNSESVIETVLRALFWRGEDQPQLGLFDDEAPVVEVHRKWDRAADREKKSRTLFAQHAIKPNEVAEELKATDTILGGPKIVEQFVKTACQRLNTKIERSNGHWKFDPSTLPKSIQATLHDHHVAKIVFDQFEKEHAALITRNHPLVSTLADYLFETALNPDGDRTVAARCGIIRSKYVESVSTLLLLRLRFLIKGSDDRASVAEECVVAGFIGELASEEWMAVEEAERLFDTAQPSANVSDSDRKYWVEEFISKFDIIIPKLDQFASRRARELSQSHEKLRKTIKDKKVVIEPLIPVDVLAVSIILPQPEV